MDDNRTSVPIPVKWVGPIRISGNVADIETTVPLATFESPLWPSVQRGAKVSRATADGVIATLVDERMTRSILLEALDATTAYAAVRLLDAHTEQLRKVAAASSRFVELVGLRHELVGNLIFLRFEFVTGDASGHNMATLAADALMRHILTTVPGVSYVSISGNYCTDKKASAVNGILGRGKNVVAELLVPRAVVAEVLHTSAQRIAALNVRKNLIGSVVAGSIRTANAHYANMLLAFYLATGQDAANIVEGSQGITHAEDRDGDLYFSCTLPNLIVGSVGNGKGLDFVQDNLDRLGCRGDLRVGDGARRLAVIVAATVLCGELSLLAAQTNPGELMRAHVRLERDSISGH
ncbi:hydroxymethylglutaryl-CoA reductase [Nocardia sp. CDC159]|uniref:Hydroxymethylglutaryl-CoA reductase n=1 Tax=Nocardia pulmonis TaxID=2951408 RepID=A0A9X2EI68_9NOCA|nr:MULTISPECIES: hydroxymethylglutaryl-CoA reductase [Nocardia]MCM6778678.1 hydroxymethylglutaryl-CoA reductase [Nocardia pulmonis]MCM6791567.1 hydroxymethylglutaryl-CoA reductase [Nocardia sp. CDC159]